MADYEIRVEIPEGSTPLQVVAKFSGIVDVVTDAGHPLKRFTLVVDRPVGEPEAIFPAAGEARRTDR